MRSSLVAYQTPIPELQPKKKWLRDYHKVDKNKKKWRFGMCCTISDDDLSEDDI